MPRGRVKGLPEFFALSPLEVNLSRNIASNKHSFGSFLLSGSRMRMVEVEAEFSRIGKIPVLWEQRAWHVTLKPIGRT
jgi:hypothetical protein